MLDAILSNAMGKEYLHSPNNSLKSYLFLTVIILSVQSLHKALFGVHKIGLCYSVCTAEARAISELYYKGTILW